jgi:uncharacterized protein DUF6916
VDAPTLSANDFAPHVDSPFVIEHAEGSLETDLAEVRELDALGKEFRRPFTLLFRGPQEPLLPQDTYQIKHEELGELEIFVVPVESGEEGTVYQAVFN